MITKLKFSKKNKSTKKKIAALIVTRLNSTRLRNKALKKIDNFFSIEILIKRLKKLKNISTIVLATSPHKRLYELKKITKKENIKFFVGSEENVLERIIRCSEKFKIDSVIRITGDDIFRDVEKLDKAIISHKKSNKDITVMQNIPYGLGSEIFNLDVLKIIYKKMDKKCDSGYLSWFIDRKIFNVNNFDCKFRNYKDIVISLDYKIDLIIMNFILKKLGIYFKTDDLINLYVNNKKKFKNFKFLRDKVNSKFKKFHHPSKKIYRLNI